MKTLAYDERLCARFLVGPNSDFLVWLQPARSGRAGGFFTWKREIAETELELIERLALYRRNIARGWSGNHFWQVLEDLAVDESNPQKQQAATKAINSFLSGENNAERLIRVWIRARRATVKPITVSKLLQLI